MKIISNAVSLSWMKILYSGNERNRKIFISFRGPITKPIKKSEQILKLNDSVQILNDDELDA
ncbi:MAG: hypothetical protein IPF58_18770 [Saprospirales bacterium]|nr:hypothetical protein [Saprospirales bacterium]